MPIIQSAPNRQKTTLDGTEKIPISGSQYVTTVTMAGFSRFASYAFSAAGGYDSVPDNTDFMQVSVDTETVDSTGLASVSGNEVTIAEDGWYYVSALLEIAPVGTFDGWVRAYLNWDASNDGTPVYAPSAAALSTFKYHCPPVLNQLFLGDAIRVYVDNHSGGVVAVQVVAVDIIKVG